MTWTRQSQTPVHVLAYHANVLGETEGEYTPVIRLQLGFASVDLSEADAASLAEYLTSK